MDARLREAAALLALLRVRPGGASWGQMASEVAFEGSAEAVLRGADYGALFDMPVDDSAIEAAHSEIAEWHLQGLRFVTVLDEDYPSRLLDIRETPPFLFYEGELVHHDAGMSVVGSRKASSVALDLAQQVSQHLVSQGLTVIAGLAAGVDGAAHRAALDAGGRTVAFIGNGITQAYPKENAGLQREIAERGLVLSQFYPDAPPTKFTFPMRNASMSGYGLATIIVEAGETSGTRIQARLAREHGRPVILSSRVAADTSWGAAMVGAPGVYVASTLGELKDAVQDVVEAPRRLDAALAQLAAS
jgi:DNA processing protein